MDGYVTIKTEIDTKEFDAQMKHIESKMIDIEDKLKQADMGFEVGDTEKLEAEYERLGNQLLGLKEKQEKYNQSIKEAQMAGFNKIKESVDGVGTSIQKVTRRIGKMALAVFGIRSAFMFIRNAINTIASDDDQLKADIDYMKSAIAYTLEPLVRSIVNLAKQLMFYIGYIVKAWTGRNIFANANKGLENANKQAKGLNKELNKTTASFDEMNTLQDSSSSGGGGGVTPSFDLTALEDYPIPSWLQWIVDHKDEAIAGLSGIAAGLVALKIGFSGIQALGIGIAITGIVRTVQKIIDFIKKPTFKNFMGILEGIAIAVGGIAIAFAAWPVAIGAAIALVVVELVNNFNEIMGLFNGLLKWIDTDFRNMMVRLFGPIGNIIANAFSLAVTFARDIFNSFYGGLRQIVEGIIRLFKGDLKGGLKQIFSGFLDILTAPFQGMLRLVSNVIDDIVELFEGLWDRIKKPIDNTVKNAVNSLNKINPVNIGINVGKGIKNFFGFAKGGIVLPKLATGGIINNPGRGVPIGQAIGGEKSMEGVIPLTDSQMMSLLGETIGRYITVNLTNITKLDGRQIARKVDKVNQSNDFVFNRR